MVADAKTGELLCDAIVTLKQNGHPDEVVEGVYVTDNTKCSYPGAFERSGDFDVVATKAGYAAASQKVTVTQGECHVDSQTVTLKLASTP